MNFLCKEYLAKLGDAVGIAVHIREGRKCTVCGDQAMFFAGENFSDQIDKLISDRLKQSVTVVKPAMNPLRFSGVATLESVVILKGLSIAE